MSAKRGESAFPRRGATIGNGAYDMGELGMTLRDYFAAAALQGWLSTAPTVDKEPLNGGMDHARRVAEMAFVYADAMLKARDGNS